jgi:hypothetical protein
MTDSWIVDAVEDGWVRVEDPAGSMLDLPADWLPEGIREGHVVRVETAGRGLDRSVRFTIDEAATERRRATMSDLRERLKRGPSGDLDL